MLSAIIQTEDDLRFKMYNRHRRITSHESVFTVMYN